eukprot:365942-Chlamydomonas_euryale.AAC.89
MSGTSSLGSLARRHPIPPGSPHQTWRQEGMRGYHRQSSKRSSRNVATSTHCVCARMRIDECAGARK